MQDDLVERLRAKYRGDGPGLGDEAADRITTLTARLAALEQATPEEVASAAADAMERETAAINAERIGGHEMPRMYRQEKERMTRAVLSAIAPALRAQGAAVERERAAAVCEEIAEVYERQDQTGDAARECAVMIRAGGSGG